MFKVDREICIACEQCIKDCPVNDIYLKEGKAHIKNEACIKCGHCIAICPVKAVSTDDYDMSEVIEYNKEDFEISPDRLLNFIKFRRSVRRFKDKEVEKEKIEKIIEAGRFTQTGTNSQDVSFTVLTKDLPKIKELTYEILNKKGQYILDNMNDNIKHLERYANLWTRMYVEHKKDPQNYDRLFLNAPLAIIVSALFRIVVILHIYLSTTIPTTWFVLSTTVKPLLTESILFAFLTLIIENFSL